MRYNIVLTTAEDIVAVVDAIVAKGNTAQKDFILDFTGIATEAQVDKALEMSHELKMIDEDITSGTYKASSILARQLVTAENDNQKAAIMRIIFEQYQPFITFKSRYAFTHSIEQSCRQLKILYQMESNERDIRSTIISIATYAKALKSEGANLYCFPVESTGEYLEAIDESITSTTWREMTVRQYLGDDTCQAVSFENVLNPLIDAFCKTKSEPIDSKAVVMYAGSAFESFLEEYALKKGISLQGKTGIISKRDALSQSLSKKHRGIIEYIGQIRNAADHGSDSLENGLVWSVSKETAIIYPLVVATAIKAIVSRDNGVIEV
ncbi:MAG: hypothetical protein RR185_07800 [Angelakisella sp.]